MAKKIRNISPYGDLDVPLLGLIVAAGEAVDVTDEAAAVLLLQAENWEAAGGPTTTTGPVDAAPKDVK